MSEPSTASGAGGRFSRLPEWARPRESERRGMGSLRLAETTILILVGVFLAVATLHDVVQQTHVNHRLNADLRTWRTVTGHDYHTIGTEQDEKGHTTRDVACGNVSAGGPRERTQLCLILDGATVDGLRSISGGYYLPPYTQNNPVNRYACFGVAAEATLCYEGKRPAGSSPTPAVKLGRPR